VAQAQLDRGVHPGGIPVPDRRPDPLDGRRVDAGVVFGADGGDGVQIGRDADPAVGRCFVLRFGHVDRLTAVLRRMNSMLCYNNFRALTSGDAGVRPIVTYATPRMVLTPPQDRVAH
jgi:hypothetical protein